MLTFALSTCLPAGTGATGKNEVTRDSSRSQRNRLEMKRTSSEGKALDYDEPVKENAKHDGYKYTKAKTHVSGWLGWYDSHVTVM